MKLWFHLHALDQSLSLDHVLISFHDVVCQFVDDGVQRALILQGSAQIQLQNHRTRFIYYYYYYILLSYYYIYRTIQAHAQEETGTMDHKQNLPLNCYMHY